MSGTKTVTQQIRQGEVIPVTFPETTLYIDVEMFRGRPRVSITHCGNIKVGKPMRLPVEATNLDQSPPIADIQNNNRP